MSTDNSIDQQFVQYIVQSLVSQPDAVKIERSIDEKGVLLELTVAPDDLGRVIGKRGNTAQSIRTLLRALGTKNDARYNLKIVDVGGPGGRSDAAAPAAASTAVDEPSDDQTASVSADEPAVQPTEDASSGADAWAHLRSEEPPVDNTSPDETGESSTDEGKEEPSVVEKTRKELEDLADINI